MENQTNMTSPTVPPPRPRQNWREISKTTVLALITLACLVTTVFLIWFSYTGSIPSPREGLYKDIITFILSLIASVILGYWFARLANIEKVDTIAERSTEKMVLLSLQLEELRTYLDETEQVAQTEVSKGSTAGALSAYCHRTQAAAHLISSLASSNETFRGDWLGVVSLTMRQNIEQKYENLRRYFEANHKLRERSSTGVEGKSSLEDAREIMEAQQTIEQVRKDLPITVHTSPTTPPLSAVSVKQEPGSLLTDINQDGEITISVKRDAFIVTGTGKLTPKMIQKPFVQIELISSPQPHSKEVWKYTVGVGTNYDFNIRLNSIVYGKFLHHGDYKFRYVAKITSPQEVRCEAT